MNQPPFSLGRASVRVSASYPRMRQLLACPISVHRSTSGGDRHSSPCRIRNSDRAARRESIKLCSLGCLTLLAKLASIYRLGSALRAARLGKSSTVTSQVVCLGSWQGAVCATNPPRPMQAGKRGGLSYSAHATLETFRGGSCASQDPGAPFPELPT
ncbi:hypothetical protein GQ53DRAFT_267592 [Thozetella sp. PMI_491]|nr:hypothetical protein GQ53DRAFT_267592 [Thozetella sp. PMI_491]